MNSFEVVVGGEVVVGAARGVIREPWSGKVVAEVPLSGESVAERAVAHAAETFD